MLLKNGEPFASFLNTVNAVRTEGRRLALITDQPFYREWIMEETNRKALNNMISYYTDAPKGFELEVEVRKKEENRENRDDGCGENGGDRSGDNSDMRKKLEQRLNKLKKKEN